MHYNYFFNGCSWTYGTDLEDIKRDRYSTLVSEGKSHVNIAMGGSSNDRIALSTIQWFEKGNTCDTAIIQWTFTDRTIYWQDNNPINILPAQNQNNKVKEVQRSYYQFYTDRIGEENYYKNIFLLKTYFELKKINYRMLTIKNLSDIKNPNWKFDNEVISIRHDWGVTGGLCPKFKIKKTGEIKSVTNSHPQKSGHQRIAEEIKKIL